MNKLSRHFYLILLPFFCISTLFAQNAEEDDQGILLPGLSPVILDKGESELNYFGAFSRVPEVFGVNQQGRLQKLDIYQNLFQSAIQLTRGFHEDPIVNYGMDMGFFRYSNVSQSSNLAESFYLISVSPRVRWAPFKRVLPPQRSFFLQHSINFPVLGNAPNSPGPSWVNQFVYIERLGYKVILQGQASFILSSREQEDQLRPVSLPASLLMAYILSNRISLFTSIQYSPILSETPLVPDGRRYLSRSGTHLGGGLQVIYSTRTSLFLNYQRVIQNYLGGGTHSFNFGLRFSTQ